MNRTSIEWTDFSANPLKYRDAAGTVVWACVHASPGCQHCYAETLAHRYRKGGPFNVPTTAKVTPFLDERELHRMLTYKPASRKRCFVGDMTDIFGEWVPDDLLDMLFAAFALRPDVTWQVLTKRASRLSTYVQGAASRVADCIGYGLNALDIVDRDRRVETANQILGHGGRGFHHPPLWPLPNVWLGVSVEDQPRADERILHLLQTPAAVRFVSAEPLLGPVDLSFAPWPKDRPKFPDTDDISDGRDALRLVEGTRIDWVIVGGESGPGARPCDVAWVRSIVRQCADAGTACFVKQFGSKPQEFFPRRPEDPKALDAGWMAIRRNDTDGSELWFRNLNLNSRKGSDPSEWPADLRVRQFPCEAVPA